MKIMIRLALTMSATIAIGILTAQPVKGYDCKDYGCGQCCEDWYEGCDYRVGYNPANDECLCEDVVCPPLN